MAVEFGAVVGFGGRGLWYCGVGVGGSEKEGEAWEGEDGGED